MYIVFSEIRLDFNQALLNYHTSLDAVMLVGLTPRNQVRLFANCIPENTAHEQRKVKNDVVEEHDQYRVDGFSLLPHEVMVHIFQYLDLKSLCRSAQVNRQWYQTSLDPCLYHELSLKVSKYIFLFCKTFPLLFYDTDFYNYI